MRKLFVFVAAAAAVVPAGAAHAQDMNLADFLRRSDALAARRAGPNSAEYQRLRRELQETFRRARNERLLARRQRREPMACLRPGVVATNQQELFNHFRSIPEAERATITVHQAYMRLMAQKFPCRGNS